VRSAMNANFISLALDLNRSVCV